MLKPLLEARKDKEINSVLEKEYSPAEFWTVDLAYEPLETGNQYF